MKKTLAVILALVAILSLMSIPAMAAPSGQGPDPIECDAKVSASVVKNKGNTNTLTIVVNGVEATFVIDNNAKDVYEVDGYQIYVGTYGNVKICDCYVVGVPAAEEEIVNY